MRRTRDDYFLSLNSIDLLEFIISIENEFGFELADDALAESKGRLLDEWAQFIRRGVST
jgi:acyl carrier protein